MSHALEMRQTDASARDASRGDGLSRALEKEARLMDDLASVLEAQRDAVADADVEAIEDSVYRLNRLIATLAEAQRHRRRLTALREGAPEEEKPGLPGERPGDGPEVGAAMEQLRSAARAVSRDLDINRRILEHTDETTRDLFAALRGPEATYDRDVGRRAAGPGDGFVLNRRA
jgi:hypothetical protein